jgi:hypothetical protein
MEPRMSSIDSLLVASSDFTPTSRSLPCLAEQMLPDRYPGTLFELPHDKVALHFWVVMQQRPTPWWIRLMDRVCLAPWPGGSSSGSSSAR